MRENIKPPHQNCPPICGAQCSIAVLIQYLSYPTLCRKYLFVMFECFEIQEHYQKDQGKNIVACSPDSPLNRILGSMTNLISNCCKCCFN